MVVYWLFNAIFVTISDLNLPLGGMLLVLATLRAAVPFSPFATHGPHSPRAGSSLLSQLDSPLPDVFYSQAAKDRYVDNGITKQVNYKSKGSIGDVSYKFPASFIRIIITVRLG